MVLHTWGQNLGQHLHVHCVVTDGALSLDGERWLTPPRRGFLFPTAALSKVLRGKYLDALAAAHRSGELCMPGDEDPNDTRAFDCLKASLQSNEMDRLHQGAVRRRRQRPRLPREIHPLMRTFSLVGVRLTRTNPYRRSARRSNSAGDARLEGFARPTVKILATRHLVLIDAMKTLEGE